MQRLEKRCVTLFQLVLETCLLMLMSGQRSPLDKHSLRAPEQLELVELDEYRQVAVEMGLVPTQEVPSSFTKECGSIGNL